MSRFSKNLLTLALAAVIFGGQPLIAKTENILTLPLPDKTSLLPRPEIRSQNNFSADEQEQLRNVIRTQIKAFRKRDADLAFSVTSASMRRHFTSAQNFLSSMARNYKPVFTAERILFDSIDTTGQNPVQRLYVTDRSGRQWLAFYVMEKLPENQWKIAGCMVRSAPGFNI